MFGLFSNSLSFSLFVPKSGPALAGYIIGALAFGLLFLFAMTKVPPRYRKMIIIAVTFLMGWFYLLEFFIPGTHATSFARGKFLSAESQIVKAQQNLQSIGLRGNGISVDEKSTRTAVARRELDSAATDLQAAVSSVSSQQPEAEKEYKAAVADANRFADKHHLDPKKLDRDGQGNIQDARTAAAAQRMQELGDALGQAQLALKGDATPPEPGKRPKPRHVLSVDEIGQQIETATPAKMQFLAAQAGHAAETAGLAAGAISSNSLTSYKDVVGNASLVIGGFTLLLGITNLLGIHFQTVIRRRLGWPSSIALFISFFTIILLGFMSTYGAPGHAVSKFGTAGYDLLFNGALAQLQSTMFALVAFYIVSAAYRAFRVRSGESALMMIAAFIVMLAFVPVGSWLTSGLHGHLAFLKLEYIREWIMTIPNAAAQRGMAFGIGVGALAMSLRIWLSLERGSYFDRQL